MRFAFEVIFVKIYIVSRSLLLLFEREKKLVVEQDGGEIFSQYERTEGQMIRRRRRITQLSSFVIPFRNKLVVSSSSLLE